MTDKIAINKTEALNAFVEQESDRYRVRFDASAARLVVQKHKLVRLLTALAEVQRQVADYDNIEIFVAPHGHMAVAKVDNRRFSISTNLENTRFEIEEDYYSYGSGENQQLFYHYENDEEVLRLVMDAVGKYIALQRVIELGSQGAVALLSQHPTAEFDVRRNVHVEARDDVGSGQEVGQSSGISSRRGS